MMNFVVLEVICHDLMVSFLIRSPQGRTSPTVHRAQTGAALPKKRILRTPVISISIAPLPTRILNSSKAFQNERKCSTDSITHYQNLKINKFEIKIYIVYSILKADSKIHPKIGSRIVQLSNGSVRNFHSSFFPSPHSAIGQFWVIRGVFTLENSLYFYLKFSLDHSILKCNFLGFQK